ncbi:TPA_asm: protein 4 [Apera virus 1]|uniref:Protein 4 n=1 Tax=Apera virus 1 TaxID=2977951 RepID=A0A9N6YJA1_9RHAB|nr:TPA_asm: protein 4 [Apera virus 1]
MASLIYAMNRAFDLETVVTKLKMFHNPHIIPDIDYDWRKIMSIRKRLVCQVKHEYNKTVTPQSSCYFHDYGRTDQRPCLELKIILETLEHAHNDSNIKSFCTVLSTLYPNEYLCWDCTKFLITSENFISSWNTYKSRRIVGSFPAINEEFDSTAYIFDPRQGTYVPRYVRDQEMGYCSNSSGDITNFSLSDPDLSL